MRQLRTSVSGRQYRPRAKALIGLLLAMTLVAGLLGGVIHHHQGIASDRTCPLCTTTTHFSGVVETAIHEFEAAFLSYIDPRDLPDLVTADLGSLTLIRAPPLD